MDHEDNPSNDATSGGRTPAALIAVGNFFQERLVWPLGDALRAIFGFVLPPFDRLGFALQRRLIWPLHDRAIALGGAGRAVGFAAIVVLAAAAGVGALVWAAPNRPGPMPAPVADVAQLPADSPLPSTAPTAPPAPATLHGAAPSFAPQKKSGSGVGGAKAIESSPASSGSAGSPAAADKISSSPAGAAAGTSSAAKTSTLDGPAAGPAAIAVARKFAGAFVLYETGNDAPGVRKAFGATATPELSRSLLRRPPRLPANVMVPKAKVVNVVAGPSQNGVFTVSVSLLRVGITSELRLDMERLKGQRWRVTNVLG